MNCERRHELLKKRLIQTGGVDFLISFVYKLTVNQRFRYSSLTWLIFNVF